MPDLTYVILTMQRAMPGDRQHSANSTQQVYRRQAAIRQHSQQSKLTAEWTGLSVIIDIGMEEACGESGDRWQCWVVCAEPQVHWVQAFCRSAGDCQTLTAAHSEICSTELNEMNRQPWDACHTVRSGILCLDLIGISYGLECPLLYRKAACKVPSQIVPFLPGILHDKKVSPR